MQEAEFDFISGQKENNEENGALVYTVSAINAEIKTILEDSYPGVWIEGEISNFKTYNSGHSYFNLKDEKAQIKAVMFQGNAMGLTFVPQDGMNVLLFGRISAYPARGDYQIIVSMIKQAGKGTLSEAFEKLKKKLEAEGLFEQSHKREIPAFINKIGVVTSQDGAALRDILKVLDSFNDNSSVLIYPVRVQGKEAEKEIPQAIKYLNKNYPDLDVLLVGRGGGSIEDLWAFNTEPVARAIYNSKIPIISCVGHETDFTIADFTADLRAPTPSAAAETAVRKKIELINVLEDIGKNFHYAINDIIENASARLERIKNSRAFTRPHLIYEDKISYIDDLDLRMRSSIDRLIDLKQSKLNSVSHKLDLVSPLSVLKRGFSIVRDNKGQILKQADNLKSGEIVNIKLSEGEFSAKVEKNDK
ncbi:MAG: exodeoxyribonuclease VII large subunit [Elusimicrobiota bacterium]|jgi:exodeoxyribonuclease VII large subunit|nr:exodeoxyribonuclease VII large subunit [Elusimicrobiota bacterium]